MPEEAITKQLYRDIFLMAPFGIYTLDKDGVITSFNPKMAELSGDLSENAIGINALHLNTYKKVGLDTLFRQGIAGHPFETEVTYTSYLANKETVRYYRGVPIKDHGVEGQARLLLIVEDITKRKEIESELQSSARFIEENTNPLMRLDVNGNVLLTNPAANDIIHFWHQQDPPVVPPTLVHVVQNSLKTGHTQSIDLPYLDKIILFEVIPQTQNNYANVYGRDVSEERKLQALKDHFLTVTSHELRTPMTVIGGYVDLMLKGHTGPLTEMQRDYLENIIESTKKLIDFVNDTLDINKLESGAMSLTIKAGEVSKPIEKVVRSMKLLYDQAGITLTNTAKEHLVLMDTYQMERIITNLLSNALKFTPSGGYVTISTQEVNEAEVIIAIKDSGVGISPENQQLLFQKYSQLDNQKVTKMQGTGLGLVITKDLIERMNGRIWVESKVGEGSTFYLTLPLAHTKHNIGGNHEITHHRR